MYLTRLTVCRYGEIDRIKENPFVNLSLAEKHFKKVCKPFEEDIQTSKENKSKYHKEYGIPDYENDDAHTKWTYIVELLKIDEVQIIYKTSQIIE